MSKDVDPDLYDFLKENETGLYVENGQLIAYVHIYFFDLDEFIGIVGRTYFESDSPVSVYMSSNTVCVELNDIMEWLDHTILSYKNCFDDYTWKSYEHMLVKEAVV